MDREQEIIATIREYCAATGLAPSTVGMYAIKDGHIYERLVNGGACTSGTHRKIMEWFANNGKAHAS